MEWNGKFYFEWPAWMGTVYAVDPHAIRLSAVVSLPNGHELQLYKNGADYVRIAETSSRNRNNADRFEATRMFDTKHESDAIFEGDWEHLIPLINAAAAVNTLFSVRLTQEEYARLSADNGMEFEILKKKVSPRAADLLDLIDGDEEEKRVDLYRTGRCP